MHPRLSLHMTLVSTLECHVEMMHVSWLNRSLLVNQMIRKRSSDSSSGPSSKRQVFDLECQPLLPLVRSLLNKWAWGVLPLFVFWH